MKPNVLLITADDMNYNSPGVFGSKTPDITPNIDKMAADGIRFEHAHVTIAVCMPSRSVLMTGRYPHRSGAFGFDPINADCPTLQEQLRSAGYANGILGKENHLAPKEKFCWDTCVTMMNEENGQGRDPQAYYHEAKAFMNQAAADEQPFFLMANSHDPHRPFVGSEQELGKFGYNTTADRYYSEDEVEIPGFLPDLPDVRKEIAQYYTSVRRCDQTVGEILRALKESGQEENTIVMFLSDNGMAFPYAKSNCYLNSTRTPWIIRWPDKIKPGSVDQEHFIAGIDFMPTILEAVGLPPVAGVDGQSFMPLLLGQKQEAREDVFTVYNTTSAKREYPMRCLQNRSFGYIYNAWSNGETAFLGEPMNGLTYKAMEKAGEVDDHIRERVELFKYRVKEEFYDFENDPDALNNLINHPDHQEKIQTFRKTLHDKMAATEDPLISQMKEEVDAG